MSRAMDAGEIGIFVVAAFAAALVAGLAGFAFGLVAASIWLHFLTPLQTTTLIVVFGLVVQGYAVWKLRHALRFQRLWPFLAGAVAGVPAGVIALRAADAAYVRWTVGILLVAFVAYSVARPSAVVGGDRIADGGIGLASGVVGGVTGLGGILATIWCALRGWPKDEQRAVFQPVGVAIFLLTIGWLAATRSVAQETIGLILLGLPAVLLGVWLGVKLYAGLNEAAFRKLVLTLLFLSGVVLLVR
jgi:uncharacterized membrane protein YfcA